MLSHILRSSDFMRALARIFCWIGSGDFVYLLVMVGCLSLSAASQQSEYTTSDCCRQSLRRARRKGSLGAGAAGKKRKSNRVNFLFEV